MKRIDLMCKILAPTAVGIVMTYGGIVPGVLVVAGWNLASGWPEYTLLRWVYRLVVWVLSSFPGLRRCDYSQRCSFI